ncbi:phenylacetate--CoA ligase family protein [Marinifilum caeruleilacunae]|uniref:Phenylacetate--CoA ligase family protein n=1 Tax=Marinifilum caeruleilacunae TaxID=2499076 RepID=A0ABX1WT76_9BACT|nr:phenylacetate--CoA ligase family protein [Marinifilum caeruleilacunae]NOU59283.1 phenylacetate--CoA ligase family protein [Marinifilum caeruleilacunae]
MAVQLIKDLIAYKIKFGRAFERELRRIIELDQMSKNEILELKSQEFVKQYRNAYSNSPFYKELYQKHACNLNSIQDLSDIRKLPVISKVDVRTNAKQILAKSRLCVFKAYSSGTTGTPLQVYRDFSSTIKEYAYGHFFQQMHGYHLGDRVVSLRGTLNRNTFSYFDKSNNVLYLSSYHLKSDRIEEYYKLIKDFKPKVIKAYPSSMHILATELHQKGLSLDIPIGFTSSEVLHGFQKEIVEKTLHTKVYDWYGNAEQTVALGQFEDELYREFPLYSHTEFEDDHLITTSFINSAFPLIRYRVDDVVKLASCSNGLCVIKKIEGRDDDYIILKNGQKIGRLDLAFKQAREILAAQIIQEQPGEIQVNLIPDKKFALKNQNEIENNLRDLLGAECQIRFKKIETGGLIRTEKGKFNLVVSKLK